jgi:hypothetical protein
MRILIGGAQFFLNILILLLKFKYEIDVLLIPHGLLRVVYWAVYGRKIMAL